MSIKFSYDFSANVVFWLVGWIELYPQTHVVNCVSSPFRMKTYYKLALLWLDRATFPISALSRLPLLYSFELPFLLRIPDAFDALARQSARYASSSSS